MDQNTNAVERLENKLIACYKETFHEWLFMPKDYLVSRAEEIASIQRVLRQLPKVVTEEDAQCLLRFKDPLEVVSDKWLAENGMGNMPGEAMCHILWELRDKQDAVQDYELEPGFEPADEPSQSFAPQQTQQMSM